MELHLTLARVSINHGLEDMPTPKEIEKALGAFVLYLKDMGYNGICVSKSKMEYSGDTVHGSWIDSNRDSFFKEWLGEADVDPEPEIPEFPTVTGMMSIPNSILLGDTLKFVEPGVYGEAINLVSQKGGYSFNIQQPDNRKK